MLNIHLMEGVPFWFPQRSNFGDKLKIDLVLQNLRKNAVSRKSIHPTWLLYQEVPYLTEQMLKMVSNNNILFKLTFTQCLNFLGRISNLLYEALI